MGKSGKRVSSLLGALSRNKSKAAGCNSSRCHRLKFEPLERRLLLATGPVITEFMASNNSTIYDGDGAASDWIEIYNPTDTAVPLAGWYLSDKTDNLTKWEFPDDPGIDTTLDPGEYMLVFASGKDDDLYPYVDGNNYLHTNFNLSKEGENVLLIEDDPSHTIAYGYVDYPVQVADVSYGMYLGTTWRTLVDTGAPLSYLVPTAGHAGLVPSPGDEGWTAEGFDDSGWTDSAMFRAAGILITEINSGDTDFVEIQNCSRDAIDTTGWKVLLNDAPSGSYDVNAVNPTAWSLPGSIASGDVLYKTDDVADNYFGADIQWHVDGPGWVMVIDDGGNVMDFLAWGYTEAEIDSLDISYGGFPSITVGNQWYGDGAAPGVDLPEVPAAEGGVYSYTGGVYSENFDSMGPAGTTAPTGWIAGKYSTTQNRQPPNSAPNSETLYVDNGSSTSKGRSYNFGSSGDSDRALGHLATTTTGDRAAQLAITNDTGAEITEFTLQYTGEQWRDWDAGPGDPVQNLTVWYGTSPGVPFTYMGVEFDFDCPQQNNANSAIDGNAAANRETISGTFTPPSPIDAGQTFYITWHDQNDNNVSDNALAVDDFSFEGVFGPRDALKRSFDLDSNTATDFSRNNAPTPGVQNPELIVPFGELESTITGIGFSDDQQDFDDIIVTDVGDEMQGANASLWTRIEFQAVDTSALNTLTLRMKYDDGFVAYLNGTKIAERNEPGSLAYNSTASAEHANSLAVVYEDIDVTAHFGSLNVGSNVLAIHGLNLSPGDADFLIQPKLTASNETSPPGYFGNPTPGEINDPSVGPPVGNVYFDVPSTAFSDPSVTVELTADSPGADIYYTLNGTIPTEASTLYTGPLTIGDTTQVRARAYETDNLPSAICSETYVKLDAGAAAYTSDLPVVIVDTFGGGSIPDNTFETAFIGVFEPQDNGWTDFSAGMDLATRGGIRVRGSSNRAQYAFETWDEMNEDKDVSLLGLPEESDFILYRSPSFDKTLMNNSFMFEISNQIGQYATRTRFVDVFLNTGGGPVSLVGHDHNDVYVLIEKIKRGPDRVDVERLEPSDNTEPDVTGGYMLKIDRLDPGDSGFHTPNPDPNDPGGEPFPSDYGYYCYVYPKEDDLTSAQGSWIRNWIQEFEAALFAPSFTDPELGYAKYIDIEAFIDHHILAELSKDPDCFWLSAYMYKPRGGKLSMGPIWDFDRALSFESRSADPVGQVWFSGQQLPFNYDWWGRLFDDPDFMQTYIDRVHELRQDLMSISGLQTIIDTQAAQLQNSQSTNGSWWGYVNQLKNWVTNRVVWIDSNFRTAPTFNMSDGQVSPGTSVTLSYSEGSVYYTTDGSDPRASGGGFHGQLYTGSPIVVNDNTKIVARVYGAAGMEPWTEWSAPSELVLVVDTPAGAGNLAVTEINYNPYDPTPAELAIDATFTSDDFEFVEVINTGAGTIALGGARFVDGIELEFDADATLAPGGRAVAVANRQAFQARYGTGINIVGEYAAEEDAKKLSNTGEGLLLTDIYAATIAEFRFNDSGDWPGRADGRGASLEVVDTAGDYNDADNWNSSIAYGGTPGGGPAARVDVVINEVLTHTDLPDVDSIELYNTTGSDIDIGGWYLSDSWGWDSNPDNGNYKKFEIPGGTIIGAYGYRVFDEYDFNISGGLDPDDFALSGAHGDDVWLMKADGGNLTHFVDHVEFGGADNGESFGRWPDAGGDLYPMTAFTEGEANSGPRVGPVIISEVMYNPGIFQVDPGADFADYFTEQEGSWSVIADRYVGSPVAGQAVATLDVGGPLPPNFVFGTDLRAVAGNSAAVVIFDYHGPTNFKYAGLFVGEQVWKIGHRSPIGWIVDASAPDATVQVDTSYDVDLQMQGSDVTLLVGGVEKASFTFGDSLTDGSLGLGAKDNVTSFSTVSVESSGEDDMEFIELYNPTGQAINLAELLDNPNDPSQYLADWRLRKGVDMEFDEGTMIGSGETLVVLSFNPNNPDNASRVAAFRGYYGIDESVALAGGYGGKLNNGGERVQLQRPDRPPLDEPDYVPHLVEDEVNYDDAAPWPAGADGNGSSLHRTAVDLWGNYPASWTADTPSPGSVPFAVEPDPAQVVGRYIFYNNSAYDATDDDAAIAPDPVSASDPSLGKEALMPGGTAGFQNYTAYSRGINGIMVDFQDLPDGVTDLATADFTFKMGNDNDPDNWSTAPAPDDISLGFPEGQPARATIIWTDGAIANKWLQVTVNVTASTGLENPDVFYFGNSVGEVGDAGDGLVTYSDLIQTRNDINLTLPVDIDSKFDFDRSRYIDYTDLILCRNNINLSTGLNMISVPALPASAPEETLESVVAAPAVLEPDVTVETTVLHDAVLEESPPDSTVSGASLAELAWFYDREQLFAFGRPSAKSPAPQSAVDKLLSTWP